MQHFLFLVSGLAFAISGILFFLSRKRFPILFNHIRVNGIAKASNFGLPICLFESEKYSLFSMANYVWTLKDKEGNCIEVSFFVNGNKVVHRKDIGSKEAYFQECYALHNTELCVKQQKSTLLCTPHSSVQLLIYKNNLPFSIGSRKDVIRFKDFKLFISSEGRLKLHTFKDCLLYEISETNKVEVDYSTLNLQQCSRKKIIEVAAQNFGLPKLNFSRPDFSQLYKKGLQGEYARQCVKEVNLYITEQPFEDGNKMSNFLQTQYHNKEKLSNFLQNTNEIKLSELLKRQNEESLIKFLKVKNNNKNKLYKLSKTQNETQSEQTQKVERLTQFGQTQYHSKEELNQCLQTQNKETQGLKVEPQQCKDEFVSHFINLTKLGFSKWVVVRRRGQKITVIDWLTNYEINVQTSAEKYFLCCWWGDVFLCLDSADYIIKTLPFEDMKKGDINIFKYKYNWRFFNSEMRFRFAFAMLKYMNKTEEDKWMSDKDTAVFILSCLPKSLEYNKKHYDFVREIVRYIVYKPLRKGLLLFMQKYEQMFYKKL